MFCACYISICTMKTRRNNTPKTFIVTALAFQNATNVAASFHPWNSLSLSQSSLRAASSKLKEKTRRHIFTPPLPVVGNIVGASHSLVAVVGKHTRVPFPLGWRGVCCDDHLVGIVLAHVLPSSIDASLVCHLLLAVAIAVVAARKCQRKWLRWLWFSPSRQGVGGNENRGDGSAERSRGQQQKTATYSDRPRAVLHRMPPLTQAPRLLREYIS